ncbi:MAG TPA: hypothetical protein VFA15_04220 [Nitrososphaera sp.]|nr:hypothetical protein [Nitrososphaera sp.]
MAIKGALRVFVVGMLYSWVVALTAACEPFGAKEATSTMEATTTKQETIEHIKELALQAVKDQLSSDYEYATTVEDRGTAWEVTILPKGRVRGGGAQVTVAKDSLKVLNIQFLQ